MNRKDLIDLARVIYIELAAKDETLGNVPEEREKLATAAFMFARTFLKHVDDNYPPSPTTVTPLGIR
ncbi:hypothetical protein [Pseudoxanthomonas japonensis]|uniref:hypothetical protein n=1 Tax=Pseudoxanthomonas japonensis TaxID=69284 RepID=UPI001BCCDDF8|nr:hypothetical protein [Pseudoxanthomonas japonensis]